MKHCLIIIGLLFNSAVLACTESQSGHWLTGDSSVRIHYQFEPTAVQAGKPFSLSFQVCDNQQALSGISLVKFDATMPAHGHGMNYLPQVQDLGQSQYRIDDLLLHMPGNWQFTFDVRYDDAKETQLSFDYTI